MAAEHAEIHIVDAHRDDRIRLQVGEVMLSLDAADVPRQLHDLGSRSRGPLVRLGAQQQLMLRLWTLHWQGRSRRPAAVIDAREMQARWREEVG